MPAAPWLARRIPSAMAATRSSWTSPATTALSKPSTWASQLSNGRAWTITARTRCGSALPFEEAKRVRCQSPALKGTKFVREETACSDGRAISPGPGGSVSQTSYRTRAKEATSIMSTTPSDLNCILLDACGAAYDILPGTCIYTADPIYSPKVPYTSGPQTACGGNKLINAATVGQCPFGIVVAFRGTLPPS